MHVVLPRFQEIIAAAWVSFPYIYFVNLSG